MEDDAEYMREALPSIRVEWDGQVREVMHMLKSVKVKEEESSDTQVAAVLTLLEGKEVDTQMIVGRGVLAVVDGKEVFYDCIHTLLTNLSTQGKGIFANDLMAKLSMLQ